MFCPSPPLPSIMFSKLNSFNRIQYAAKLLFQRNVTFQVWLTAFPTAPAGSSSQRPHCCPQHQVLHLLCRLMTPRAHRAQHQGLPLDLGQMIMWEGWGNQCLTKTQLLLW